MWQTVNFSSIIEWNYFIFENIVDRIRVVLILSGPFKGPAIAAVVSLYPPAIENT
ncbi:MAG: hypothetical protein LUQ38_02000 [Methanotrichaceae archaeon]|nr:hypothetical protein [Methanotrichaceae archaeon]